MAIELFWWLVLLIWMPRGNGPTCQSLSLPLNLSLSSTSRHPPPAGSPHTSSSSHLGKKRMTIWHYAESRLIGKRLSTTLFARTSLLVLLNTKMGQLSIFEKKQFCRFSFLSSTHAGGTTWSFSFFFSMHEMNTEQLGRSYWRDVQCTSADSAAWQLRLLWTSRLRNLKPNIQESLPNLGSPNRWEPVRFDRLPVKPV